MERSRQIHNSTSSNRPRLMRLVVLFLLVSLLIQANTFAPGNVHPAPLIPPSEKILSQYGQWETEYWDDSGLLSFRYAGDPNPADQPLGGSITNPDFVISSPTLLTAIIDVHINPNTDAIYMENTGSPGSLTLVDAVGNTYGPFAAERGGVAINNGKAESTVLWVAFVDHVELPPGHYWVHDSEPSTQLRNAQTLYVGATLVKGVDAAAFGRYMDGLIAAYEPELFGENIATATSADPTGSKDNVPDKITYSKPQPVVNNKPDPALPSYPANNPSFPCEFVIDKPMMLTKIMDYHIYNGKGSSPSVIGVQENHGLYSGPWRAYGQAYNGIPNSIWVVTPNYELPAGSYQVRDNENSTLSADANSKAMCVVNLSPAVNSLKDNVTGKYVIGFGGEGGDAIDYTMVLAVIDHKKSLEIGTIIEGQPLKMDFTVTDRTNGVVKAEYRQGFILSDYDLRITVLMTFTKRPDTFGLTGQVIAEGATIQLSGKRTSADLPGFVPKPHAGIGSVGSIPGPGSEGQAAAGIAFPTLATLIFAAAARSRSRSRGGGGGDEEVGDDGGGDPTGDDSDYVGSDAEDAETSTSSEGGDAGDGSGSNQGGDTGSSSGTGTTAQSQPVVTSPPPAPVPPPSVGPQDGQTMSVNDPGDGLDKTYVYNGKTGEWINPLTGGMYVAANYAASAKAQAETDAEIKKRAETDAKALADGPTKWVASSAASAGSAGATAPSASGTTVVPADPGTASTSATISPAPKTTGAGKVAKTPDLPQGPNPMIRDGIINMKADFEVINKRLADENIYVQNKFQRTNMVLDGAAKLGNTVWDYTAGWVTGSTGLRCEGYYDKTNAGITEAVLKQFPNAKVEQAIFQEKSTITGKGVIDWFDAKIEDNHVFTRVTLPDGSVWAVDFHGHNASNLPTNPPIMRPYEEVRREWMAHLKDEFHES